MKLWKLNPFVRSALHFLYKPRGYPVCIADFHVIYVDSGEMYIRCEGREQQLPKGSLVHLPAGTVYELCLPKGHENDYPMLAVVNFDLTQRGNSYKKIKYPERRSDSAEHSESMETAELADIAENDSFLTRVHIFENAQSVRYLMMKLIEEFGKEQPFFRELCSCTMKEILINLHRENPPRKANSASPVQDLKKYLESNFTAVIDNTSLAGRYGYHTNSLERLFKDSTGMSIRQYVLSLRLAEARRLLGESSMSLSDIARAVGFGNYSYFSDYFKRRVGVSPAEYRKQLRNMA